MAKEPIDSSPIMNDPLRDLSIKGFTEVYNTEDETPPDIRDFIETNGINERAFRCILKRVTEEINDPARSPYIRSWQEKVPTIEWIGLNWGPGEYMLVFQWRCKDPETEKLKSYMKELRIYVDDSFQDQYEEYQLHKQLQRMQRQKKLVANVKFKSELDNAIMGGTPQNEPVDKVEAGKQYIKETVEAANMLGLSRKSGFEWEKFLPLVLPLVPALLESFSRRATDQVSQLEKIYSLLLTEREKSSTQLLELAKAHTGPTSGTEMIKEFKEMIFGAVDIKEALAGNKQSIADKIFDLIQGMAPVVMQLAMQSQESREKDFRYKMAQTYMNNSAEVAALKEDPSEQIQFVKKCDAFFGWRQTDLILATGGLERPAECPRIAEQEGPISARKNTGSPGTQQGVAEPGDGEDDPMGEE